MNRPYRLFEVTGIELEYPVVDGDLNARCLVEPLFRRIAGRPTSDAEYRETIFSNELAAHVFEIKTREPERSLARAESVVGIWPSTGSSTITGRWLPGDPTPTRALR